jgi:hypothetical protein
MQQRIRSAGWSQAGLVVASVLVAATMAAAQPKEAVPSTLVSVEGTVLKSDGTLGVNVPIQVFRAIEASNPAESAPIRQSVGSSAIALQRSPLRTVRTDDKGVFKVQLPAGKYTYRAGTPAMGLASGELELKAGETKKVEIKLRGGQ